MTHPAAVGTGHVVRDIGLVRALPAAVSRGAAIGTAGSITFTQRAVQECQFSQLVPAQVVLILRYLNPLSDDLTNLKIVSMSMRRRLVPTAFVTNGLKTYTSHSPSD